MWLRVGLAWHLSCASPAPLLHLSCTSPAPLPTSPAPLLSCAPPDPCCTSPHLSSTLPAPLLTPVVAPFASNFLNVYRCCSGGCTHRSYFSRFPKVLLRSDLYFQKVSTGHSWAMHFPRVRDGVVPNMHLWAKLLQTCKWNIFQKFFHVPLLNYDSGRVYSIIPRGRDHYWFTRIPCNQWVWPLYLAINRVFLMAQFKCWSWIRNSAGIMTRGLQFL